MTKVLIVVHQNTSTPGLIGQLLTQKGLHLDIRCPAMGDALPSTLEHHIGAIVFGGPMSANDDTTLPFIRQELDWIEQTVLDSDRPYLGICLGGQLLARVLGSTVAPRPDHRREIGYFPIHLTPAGQEEFGCDRLQVFQWHGEGFEIPTDGLCLATGDLFPNQAFRYGDRAYGLQFHPEITRDMIAFWTENAPEQLLLPGAQSRAEQLHNHDRYGEAIASWLDQFLDQWLDATAYSSAA